MKKIFLILILTSSLFAQIPHWFKNLPESPPGVYLATGITGKYFNMKTARDIAVHQAVKSIAKQKSVDLIFELTTKSDGRFIIGRPDFEEIYEEIYYTTIMENHKIIDSVFTHESCFYLIQYPADAKPVKVNHGLVAWGEKPGWVLQSPAAPDFHYGIGAVARYRRTTRGWQDADALSRFDLGKALFLEVETIREEIRTNNYTITKTFSEQFYNLTLKNCAVIKRWYDAETDQYYSLSHLPKKSFNINLSN
ncbi:MAG: hypothetical protein ACLFQM_06370 [Fidelibacterota bacterium]